MVRIFILVPKFLKEKNKKISEDGLEDENGAPEDNIAWEESP